MRVASFDVFDTLLTRRCAVPRDLFVVVGRRLQALKLSALEPAAFAVARRDAERAAWNLPPARAEPSLAKIYATLAARVTWNDAERDAALAVELAVETGNIAPVPAMRREVEEARATATVVFISDMYLPASVIRGWLERAGFWREGDRLFVSNEAGASKHDGTLFEKIRDELRVDFSSWTHQGDNPRGDVAQPRRRGITATLRPAAALTAREQHLRGAELFAPPWRSLLAGAARLARLDQPPADADPAGRVRWAGGADLAGPLFFGFVDWCLAEAARRELTDLFFLARAGQVFLRIAETIQQVRPRPVRLHYLPVSRLAVIGTGAFEPDRLRRLAAPSVGFHSARQAFAHLGLPETEDLPPELQSEWNRNLTGPERARLADWLLAPERRERVQAALAWRGQQARAFFSAQGLTAGTRAALVDTGWRGTIQHHIEGILGENGQPVPLAGFYLGLHRTHPARCAGPTLGYSNTFLPLPLEREGALCDLIELMAPADHGPVLGYAADSAGKLQPRCAPMDEAVARAARSFQESLLAFVRRTLEADAGAAAAPEADLARVVIGNFAEFHRRPARDEVEGFGRLPHCGQIFEQSAGPLCSDLGLGAALRAMFDPRRRPAGWWPQGQARLAHAPLWKTYLAAKRLQWGWPVK